MALTVLVADEDTGLREVVKRVLGRALAVVGEADSGEEAVRLALTLQPSVVLMSIGISGLDAIAATRSIKAALPEAKIILLTGHGEEAYLSATGKSGADAFLPKRRVRVDLLTAIREVAGAGWRRETGSERRRRRAAPGDVFGWDGKERRSRSGGDGGGPVDVTGGDGGGSSA